VKFAFSKTWLETFVRPLTVADRALKVIRITSLPKWRSGAGMIFVRHRLCLSVPPPDPSARSSPQDDGVIRCSQRAEGRKTLREDQGNRLGPELGQVHQLSKNYVGGSIADVGRWGNVLLR
jgi:hypothetical protein